jgi:hypothetical protein
LCESASGFLVDRFANPDDLVPKNIGVVSVAHAQKIIKFALGNAKKDTTIVVETVTENDDHSEAKVVIDSEVHSDLPPLLNEYLTMAIRACLNDADAWCMGKVTGVSFKHAPEGIGAVFSIQLHIDDGPICDNTPYQSPDKLDQQKIMKLHHEIVQCLNGKRAYDQGLLDLSLPPEPVKSAKAKAKSAKQKFGVVDGNTLTGPAKRAKAAKQSKKEVPA